MAKVLQSELKRLAANGGWYDQRRTVRLVFIKLVASICSAVTLTMIVWARRESFPCWLHHVDVFLSQTAQGLRWNWILEIEGIIIVIFAGLWQKATNNSR